MYQETDPATLKAALGAMEGRLGTVLADLWLPMLDRGDDVPCIVRSADADPKEAPPKGYQCYLIEGDLDLPGAVSLSHLNAEGGDGNMLFIVTGNVSCERLINEWGSVIAIGGDLTVRELFFAAREDSTSIVIGKTDIWAYVGRDIWISTGGAVSIEYGFGYALPIGYTNPVAQSIRPKNSEAASRVRLGLEDDEALNDLDFELYSEAVPSLR